MESRIDQLQIAFDSESLWVLNTALALVMFGIALDIRLSGFRSLLKSPRSLLAGIGCQFFLLPFLTFLLVMWLQPQPSFALGMILVAACPGGNVSNFMTHLSRGNTELSVCLTAIATLLAVVMTPMNFAFWGGNYAPASRLLQQVHIDPFEMVRLVAFILAIPLLAGMGLRRIRPRLAASLSPFFKVASLMFFVVLVLLAIWKDREVFAEAIGWVFGIVLLHNLLALCTGYLTGRAFGVPEADTRTLTLETGIQNSGLGLLLIFTFFGGMGGMALVAACWGIWHLISGLLLAGYWGALRTKKHHTV
ncbi:bile acid:sodium symporter family protein [Robiginitalea sp. SC105]|uniref:bile acid:sodium symporter family protein n=1 Tax=Robiginitalea sp. SC105 TaxID=2762332 RepID=UPI00163A211B|nr:bile acid:sodium symporter family protein [Robiginitalea sp. SC105]MBC2839915.1 bile acid:sodium symporter family protein [Robiginitalea sp. SC105]